MKKWTVPEVAARLNKSPQLIRLLAQRGKLPFIAAEKTSSRWNYTIFPEKAKEYIGEKGL